MISIVYGNGRSGSNLILECLTGNSYFKPLEIPEDKLLFTRGIQCPDRYLCKSDIVYCPSYNHFINFMKKNPSTNIVWSLRHPYDSCLSRLYRGRPMAKRNWKYADDATFDGCLESMLYSFEIYRKIKKDYPLSFLPVKMEDIIVDIEKETKRICDYMCILWDENMCYPHLRMRHPGKRERYKTLDKSQINIYKQLPELYDGYFRDKMEDVKELFEYVRPLVQEFGYNMIGD